MTAVHVGGVAYGVCAFVCVCSQLGDAQCSLENSLQKGTNPSHVSRPVIQVQRVLAALIKHFSSLVTEL